MLTKTTHQNMKTVHKTHTSSAQNTEYKKTVHKSNEHHQKVTNAHSESKNEAKVSNFNMHTNQETQMKHSMSDMSLSGKFLLPTFTNLI